MADSQVSVGASLAYGWRLWAANWRAIWGVLALSSLAMTVYWSGVYAQNQTLLGASILAILVTQPMMFAAVFRIAFADRHPGDPTFAGGHAGIQWGRMEWRQLASQALLTLFFTVIGVLLVILAVALGLGIILSHGGAKPPATPEAVMAALGPQGQAILTIVGLAAAAIVIFFSIRLSLAFAATADRGKITVLESWPLTHGQFWRILVALLVVQLPLTIVQSIITAAAADNRQFDAAVTAMTPGPAMISALASGVVYGGLVAPITAAILAYFYRMLAPPPPGGLPETRP